MAAKKEPVPPVPVAPKKSAAVAPIEPTPAPASTSANPPATAPLSNPYAAPPAAASGATPIETAQPNAFSPAPAGAPQGLSIASMVTGIGGLVLWLFGLGFLPSLAAVITGHLAVKRQPYAKAFWLTGLITGYIGAAISLISLLFFIGAILLFLTMGATNR